MQFTPYCNILQCFNLEDKSSNFFLIKSKPLTKSIKSFLFNSCGTSAACDECGSLSLFGNACRNLRCLRKILLILLGCYHLSRSETGGGVEIGMSSCELVTGRKAEGRSGHTILDLVCFENPETFVRQKYRL